MNVLQMRVRLSERDVEALVSGFYARARRDPLVGPVFAARVAADAWPEHLERMCRFWSTTLRGTGSYRGNPMAAHQPLTKVGPEHFERWLSLFAETAGETLDEDVAQAVLLRARRMASGLKAAMGLVG